MLLEGIFSLEWFTALGGILILDLVLSGDNAILIAMACRELPKGHRFKAMVIGCAGAVIIRIVFTAPTEPGKYTSTWQAYGPDGQPFGDYISILINVKSQ